MKSLELIMLPTGIAAAVAGNPAVADDAIAMVAAETPGLIATGGPPAVVYNPLATAVTKRGALAWFARGEDDRLYLTFADV